MTQDKMKRIHRFYSWGLAVILIIVGTLVILSCLDLYGGVKGSYTPEAIASHFRSVAIPIYIGVLGIVGGIILNLFFPLPRQHAKSVISPREIMLRMRQKVSIPAVKKEQKLRQVLTITTAVIFVALMIYPVIYLMTPGHFTKDDPNPKIAYAAIITLIPTLIGLALCWCCQLLLNASYRREISVYKQALIDGQRAEKIAEVKSTSNFNKQWLQISLIVVAVIFVILGIINKGADDVLKKAIAICTECIGIG